ncbi:MAG: hypothetical protein JWN40_1121 [Phycisphaerales bacterium]|nr:hypothetical protein [Phycisphaerales bacterium]
MYSVTVSRSYKDKDGKWHDTQSFRFDDLLTVAKALTDAHSMISTANGAGSCRGEGRGAACSNLTLSAHRRGPCQDIVLAFYLLDSTKLTTF